MAGNQSENQSENQRNYLSLKLSDLHLIENLSSDNQKKLLRELELEKTAGKELLLKLEMDGGQTGRVRRVIRASGVRLLVKLVFPRRPRVVLVSGLNFRGSDSHE